MTRVNGCWKQHLPKRKQEMKRIAARVDDIIVGPREGNCGIAGYAGGAAARYLCLNCGNYHDKPSTGGLDDKSKLREGKGHHGEEKG